MNRFYTSKSTSMPTVPNPLRRLLLRLRLHPDTAERHAIVGMLLGEPEQVLDVGGSPDALAAYYPDDRVTVANVRPPADVVFDGRLLPFPDRSFEAVTSLDVLEHVEPVRRRTHLEELTRVAGRRIVLCCPLGSAQHAAAEVETAAWYERVTGAPHPMLAEHLERGLPTEAELRELVGGLPVRFEVLFHGDFRRADELFRLGTRAKRRPGALARYVVRRLLTKPDLELAAESGPFTNRAFLVGERPREHEGATVSR
jgi:hypothetical protein